MTEANPSVRIRLQDNIDANRLEQVEVVPCALMDVDGTVDFYGPAADDAESGNGHVIDKGIKGSRQITRIDARRLDGVVAASQVNRVDLIKIDVEGFEWPVLEGGEQTIARFRPHIVFEYNAEFAPRGKGTPPKIAEFFRAHRYRLFAIGRTWSEAVELDSWPSCADIWAVPVRG